MDAQTLHDCNRQPVRHLLTALLGFPRLDVKSERWVEHELHPLALAGLIEQGPSPRAHVSWSVAATPKGRFVGIRLALSIDLLGALRGSFGDAWRGVAPDAVLHELDLRAGGYGVVTDPRAWLRRHQMHVLADLPRRFGLDPKREGRARA